MSRPRLRKLYQEGKLQYMVYDPQWSSKLDVWLDDSKSVAGIGQRLVNWVSGGRGHAQRSPCVETVDMYRGPCESFSSEVKLTLLVDGYAVLKGYIPRSLCLRAIKRINFLIGSAVEGNPQGLTREGDNKLTNMHSNDPDLMSLYYSTPLATSVSLLLHGDSSCEKVSRTSVSLWGSGHAEEQIKLNHVHACQIALRFPQMVDAPAHGQLGGMHWHTDGINKGDISPFTLLVGIALSDQMEPFAGNLCVFPGSHYSLQPYIRQFAASREPQTVARPNLGEPTQLLLQPGDVVLLHQKLAHRGGPNYSHEVRRMVYFRISHRDHENRKGQGIEDLWIEFEGMADVL